MVNEHFFGNMHIGVAREEGRKHAGSETHSKTREKWTHRLPFVRWHGSSGRQRVERHPEA